MGSMAVDALGPPRRPGPEIIEWTTGMRAWARSPLEVDHVIGSFPREGLSAALAATHRAGFGPQTRVFDGARGDVTHQLERAGLEIQDDGAPPADALLIVVTAPGRATIVAELFDQLGAESVLFAARRSTVKPASSTPALGQPDIRIGEDAGIASEA